MTLKIYYCYFIDLHIALLVFQVYDLTQLIGTNSFKTYSSLSKIQRIEWNNR